MSASVPPFNLEAEEHVTAACIVSEHARMVVDEHIRPEHLVNGALRDILAACLDAHDRGDPVDPLLLTERLPKHRERIHELASLGLPTSNVQHHAQIVRDYHTRRELIRVGQDISRSGWEPDGTMSDALERAETEVYRLTTQTETGELRPVKETLPATFDLLSKPGGMITGTPTGLPSLDNLTAGLQPGNLVVIAARPSMGKSSLALKIALHNALEQRTAAIFTLEMSAEETNQRALSAMTGVPLMRIRRRTGLTPTDHRDLLDAGARLSESPLYIDDTVNARVADIRARSRRLKTKRPDLSLVVVDYLQLMVGDARQENRNLEIASVSRGLKLLARELEIPVVALAQLNRKVEDSADKKPHLANLRDSGAIEQDADVVIFIYRDDNDGEDTRRLLVAKHRNGPTDDIPVGWKKDLATFTEGAA